MATVSVIIPTFNRHDRVIQAICSVLNQTYSDFELIVVDDASTDDTNQALLEYLGRIKCIRHDTNLGVSAARNTGMNYSTSPFIAFLDSDDRWLPEKLQIQMEFFGSHPEALICQTEETWIRRGRRVNPKKKHQKPSGDIFAPSLKLCLVSPSAVMLRKSVFEEVGLFDEGLPACEDYDMWLRISCKHPVYLIEKQLIIKEGGHSDQLSSRYSGMDRFRITAISNIINSGALNGEQLVKATNELAAKCRIYGNGCIKRGRAQEGAEYILLAEQAEQSRFFDP